MEVKDLENLYVDCLRDLYSAETQITKALPKLAKVVSAEELKTAMNDHLEVTKMQIERLEKIFGELGESPEGHECVGMKGLLEEGDEISKKVEKGPILDAALIGAAQKVEHYEIAGYGTVRSYAYMLGREEDIELLQQSLDEEGETDKALTQLAEGMINEQAAQEEVGSNGSSSKRSTSKSSSGTTSRSKSSSGSKTTTKSSAKSRK